MLRTIAFAALLVCGALLAARGADAPPSATAQAAPDTYLVVLKQGERSSRVAGDSGVRERRRFQRVFEGFTADLTVDEAARLRDDRRVRGVVRERKITATAPAGVLPGYPPALPSGVDRIDAEYAPIDETVGIAVLDSGIAPARPEFNLKAAMSFITGNTSPDDAYGHGTHVAGTAAANTDASGFRGVAPRAPLWSLRVLDENGAGTDLDLIAAIEWLTANGPALGIRVANMSLGFGAADTGNCGLSGSTVVDALHLAICQSVEAGIVYVASAGNAGADAGGVLPAAYPEVVAVSNVQDRDGRGGALNPPSDDVLYVNSNWGSVVDIAAPGTGILSTVPLGSCFLCAPTGYTYLSGTSMAAPHVAGAIATYLARNPGVSSTGAPGVLSQAALDVIAQARAQTDAQCGFTGDPDASPEPMLYVAMPDGGCGAPPADSDGDGLPDVVETQVYGTLTNDVDTDNDGCSEGEEVLGNEALGGRRDPVVPWDFYDVPVPALTPSNTGGTGNSAIGINDVLAIVLYIGTQDGGAPNVNGVDYDADVNNDGIEDGRSYDRRPSLDVNRPWLSGAPNGFVGIADALTALIQIGANCTAAP